MAWVTAGAGPQQILSAFREAEAYDRPSLLIAYSDEMATRSAGDFPASARKDH